MPLPVGGTEVQHEKPAVECVSSLPVNAHCIQVVMMLLLDRPDILIAHVGEDVRPSLVDFLCHHHHDQCSDSLTHSLDSVCQSIKYASESGNSSECACECTRTSRHFERLEDGRVVLHCLQVGGAQNKFFVAVLRRVVVDVVTLCKSAARVGWAHAPGGSDSATAIFAIISDLRNPAKTTARTNC